MFQCVDGYRFFIKIVPGDGGQEKNQVSVLCCFQGVYTKIPRVVSCGSCHKFFFVLKSFGFLGFISLFDLIGVRNSLAGTAGISPVTVLKKKASRGRARASLTQTYHLDLRVCFHHVTLCLQSNLLSRTLFLQVCVCRCHTLFTLIYPYCSGMVMFPVH